MNDDYLWDRRGPPDPEVARLEQLLHPLGHEALPPLPTSVPTPRWSWPWWLRRSLAAAAVVALAIGGWWLINRYRAPGWEVTRFAENRATSSAGVPSQRELRAGGWLETSDRERASIKVADIGTVDIEPRTRIRLIRTGAGNHRLQLARGTLHATIWAPPGQFFVETPSSTVVDLGCAYTLTIDDEGTGLVTVTLGWVGFEWRGRESFIPAGAVCALRPGVGPGTPQYQSKSPAFRAALETIDFNSGSPDAEAALNQVLEEANAHDAVTLWHLLTRVAVDQRDQVFDCLARFVPPPSGVTREGIRAGRRDVLDRWWDALGLGTASWWRTWKQRG